MNIQPRITAISETGSKIDVVITVDGEVQPMQRFQVSDLMEGGNTLENAWLLSRYVIRQQLNAIGTDKESLEQIKINLEGAEVTL